MLGRLGPSLSKETTLCESISFVTTWMHSLWPVCIHDEDPAQGAIEVCDADLYVGQFREDPAPKMCGFLDTKSRFLLLQTNIDYDEMVNGDPPRYARIESGVEAPEKSWPNGHWYSEPRRHDGQP